MEKNKITETEVNAEVKEEVSQNSRTVITMAGEFPVLMPNNIKKADTYTHRVQVDIVYLSKFEYDHKLSLLKKQLSSFDTDKDFQLLSPAMQSAKRTEINANIEALDKSYVKVCATCEKSELESVFEDKFAFIIAWLMTKVNGKVVDKKENRHEVYFCGNNSKSMLELYNYLQRSYTAGMAKDISKFDRETLTSIKKEIIAFVSAYLDTGSTEVYKKHNIRLTDKTLNSIVCSLRCDKDIEKKSAKIVDRKRDMYYVTRQIFLEVLYVGFNLEKVEEDTVDTKATTSACTL